MLIQLLGYLCKILKVINKSKKYENCGRNRITTLKKIVGKLKLKFYAKIH